MGSQHGVHARRQAALFLGLLGACTCIACQNICAINGPLQLGLSDHSFA